MTDKARGHRAKSGGQDPVAAEAAAWTKTVRQFLVAFLPTDDGGPPPVLTAIRSRFSIVVWTVLGVVLGAAVGFLLALLVLRVPDVPTLVLGLGFGFLFGAAAALVLSSRVPAVRRGGAVLLLLSPILVLLLPFLLIAMCLLLLARWPARARRK